MAVDPKNLDKYLENLKAAESYSKEVNASFKNWAAAAKNIKGISDEIKNKSKLIAELKERAAQASEEEQKILESQIGLEEEKLKQGQEQLKLLRQQVSIGKTLGNSAISFLSKQTSLVSKLFEGYSKMDGAARRTSVNLGVGVAQMENFRNASMGAAYDLEAMGISGEQAGEMMKNFADQTGRQTMLGKQALVSMGALAMRTGMGAAEMANFVGEMEAFGYNAISGTKALSEIADMSDKMGVNTAKVMKKVQANMKLLNKLNFKGGVKGMAKMAAMSEKYKISMESVAGFADKVFRPEGAIDAAANLQVLGGGLAKLGDPFKMMYEARNNPTEFAKSLIDATGAVAKWDSTSKTFEVGAMQLDRLKEAAEATGIPFDELVQTAKQQAKMGMFADSLKIKGDDAEFLQSIATMSSGGQAQVMVGVDPTTGKEQFKNLSDLSAKDQAALAQNLKKKKESDEAAAKRAQSTQELARNQSAALITKLYPVLKRLDDKLRPMLEKVFGYLANTVMPVLLKVLQYLGPGGIIAVALAFKAAQWIARGVMLGVGFNKTAGKGGLLKKLGGGIKSLFKGKTPGGGGPPVQGPKPPPGMGSAGKGATGTQAMGQSAGGQASNFLQGAVALLAISAALFIFAKALQEFEKLQNGWATLVLAGASLIVLGLSLKLMQPILNSFGTSAWPGIAAMVALSVAVMALGVATTFFAQGGVAGTALMVVALLALAFAVTLFGGLSLSGIGWAGVALILAMGAAMLMIGGAVLLAAMGISMIVDSFTNMFSIISMDNIGALLMLGPALIGVSIGVFALALSLVALGAAYLMGGFLGIFALGETADKIQTAFGDVDAGEVAAAITAINNVDMNKVAAIKDLANAMSMWSMFGSGIEINFGDLDVTGGIELKGGGKSAEMVMEEPYLTQLKDLIWDTMEKGRGGGKL